MTAAHTVTSNDNSVLEKAELVRIWFPKEGAFKDPSKLKPNMKSLYHPEIVDGKHIFVYKEYEKIPSDVCGTDAALVHVKAYKQPGIYHELGICYPSQLFTHIVCTIIGFPCESDDL